MSGTNRGVDKGRVWSRLTSAAGEDDRVKFLSLREPEILVDIGLIWRRENMSPLMRRLIQYAVLLGQEFEAEKGAKLVA